jgi:hypothetical protein
MKISRTVIFVTLVAASVASLAAAQQDMNIELYMKWGQAELVHYDVVAEYSAKTRVLEGYKTAVTDRFELSFDAAPQKLSVIGKPVFKNTVSTMSKDFVDALCLPLEAIGPYEHLDIIDAKPAFGSLELTIKRSFPAGRIPGRSEMTGQCSYRSTLDKVETLEFSVPIILGIAFAAPSLAPKHVKIGESASQTSNVIVGKDEKTIIVDDIATNGWKYTYTLKFVK